MRGASCQSATISENISLGFCFFVRLAIIFLIFFLTISFFLTLVFFFNYQSFMMMTLHVFTFCALLSGLQFALTLECQISVCDLLDI